MKCTGTILLISTLFVVAQGRAADTPARQIPAGQTPAVQIPAPQTPAIQNAAVQTPAAQEPSATPETKAIYRSVGHEVFIGNGRTTSVTTRGVLVLDPEGLRATSIVAYTLNGSKFYSVVPLTRYEWVKVNGQGGLSYSVIAKAEISMTSSNGVILESFYARGLDTPVRIDSQGTKMLPRSLSSTGSSLGQVGEGAIGTAEAKGTYALDVGASRLSSGLETFDAAVARYSGYMAAAGYVQVKP